MSDRYAFMIRRADAFDFKEWLGELNDFGVKSEVDALTRITDDGEFERIGIDAVTALISGCGITLHFWTSPSDDLVCALKMAGRTLNEWYSFANPGQNAERLLGLFLVRFIRLIRAGVLHLAVVDIAGNTGEFEWADVMNRPVDVPVGASLIVASAPFAEGRVQYSSVYYHRAVHNDVCVLCSSEFFRTVMDVLGKVIPE